MITKKLTHDIIAFCNNYIDNKNILTTIEKYPNYIHVTISVWTIDSEGFIVNRIDTIGKFINNEEDFIKYKEEVLNRLPELLEQLKENQL